MHKRLTVLLGVAAIGTLAWTASDVPSSPSPSSSVAVANFGGGSLVIPVAGVERWQLRDSFNEARGGHVHHAIDILAPRGTPVLAAVDGEVRKLFTSGDGGLTIYEADAADERIYYYAHLDRYAFGLSEGMSLHSGDVIGYVGTTGNAPANTPHLHFAVAVLPPSKEWWKGEPVNPYVELVRRGVTRPASTLRPHLSGSD
jgi:murein DD-endopeptidase MepM/ murein hydrolase activator NlpD